MAESYKKTIVKNTILLQFRKVIIILIMLYTSRLLLQRLGVESFGLYGLVGSILALFSSLRGLFASSIQRFINVSKNGSIEEINKIFSVGLKIQVILAIAFFIIVDIVGICIIPTLNISDDSRISAFWVLQLSLLGAVVTMITVPYDAVIISYERFTAYAMISLLECILKLLIVYLLLWSPFERVIYYSLLLLIVSIIIRCTNFFYCRHAFGKVVQYNHYKDTDLIKSMSQFAGWQLFGNIGFSLMAAGTNFVLNLFGGVVVNAAQTIAAQIQNTILSIAQDLNVSFIPRSMMLYKNNQMREYRSLMYLNTKAAFAIASVLAFSLQSVTPKVLEIWLGNVPQYTVEFVRATLLYLVIRCLHSPIDTLFKAAGNLAKYQIADFTSGLLILAFSYVGLYFGLPFYSVFLIMTLFDGCNFIVVLIIAKYQLGFDSASYGRSVVSRLMIALVILALLFCIEQNYFNSAESSIITNILIAAAAAILSIGVNICIVFNREERMKVSSLLVRKFKK
jgi:O-antigen/teichoic acid export membrane protein